MFDLPNWFWYALAIAVFIVINIVLWLYQRHYKVKGVVLQTPFNRFKKYEKQISRWTDISIIAVIVLETIIYGGILINITSQPSNIPVEYQQANSRLTLSVVFLSLLTYSASVLTMASLLSPFHKNMTLKKRLMLFVMCCVPLVFGILYCIFDDTYDYHVYFKFLLSCLFPVIFINWPTILLGRSFSEFYPALLRKIPLPYFQIPESKEPEKK